MMMAMMPGLVVLEALSGDLDPISMTPLVVLCTCPTLMLPFFSQYAYCR